MAYGTQRPDGSQPATSWRPLRSLRSKLQLFAVLLVLVPSALIGLLAVSRARATVENAVGRQVAEVAHDVIDEVAEAIADERANVRSWAAQDVMRDLTIGDLDKRVSRFLRALVQGGAPYRTLLVADARGRIVASDEPAAIGADLADAPWVRTALGGTDYLDGPTDRADATIDVAVPVRHPDDPRRIIGALLARYDWRHAVGVVDRIRRTLVPYGLTVDIMLLDRDGRLLGASWSDGGDREIQAARVAAGTALARRLTPAMPRGYDVEPSVGALLGHERAGRLKFDWLAVVAEPLGEAFRPVREMQRWLTIGLGALLVGALLVATYLAERMSRPLRALTRATRSLADVGTPPQPVAVRSHDEIGELASAFNAMADRLVRAQDDLLAAAKFAFVGEVAAGVAHEVRTPLGILRSSAQMLERSLPTDRAETAELTGMMIEEVDRIDRVVDGLLELARPREPAFDAVPLDGVLQRALDFVAGQARERGIRLGRDFAAAAPAARCDPEQMYQVALNLLVNALQMVPPGGRVTVRTLPAADGRIAFEVEDDGPGIPADVQARIFTPFFSLRSGGTGLGLALVQRVVRSHQGTVTVTSAVGRGTTFRVTLPVANEAS